MKHYQKGEDVLVSLPYRLTALAPLTEYRGWFGDKNADQDNNHGCKVAVYAVANQRVISAYANAKDGYQANLNECPEFLNWCDTSYMFARFERKHFRWGDAVSLPSWSDYVLVETCCPDEFQPSFTAFDQVIDSLTMQ
jgi:hypothetical protein